MPTGTIRRRQALTANQRVSLDLGVYRRFMGMGRTTIYAVAAAAQTVRLTLKHSTREIGVVDVPPQGAVAGKVIVPDDLVLQGLGRPNEEIEVLAQELAGAAATLDYIINFEDSAG